MDFEYGKIEAFKEFDKPFITITISQKVVYKTVSRKFNVFNVKYLKNLQKAKYSKWQKG